MNRFAGIVVSFGLAAGFACAERVAPAVFHVDSEAGNDGADGTRPDAAWRTLDKVNAADLIPGDQVLFKRGGLWRGRLDPKSGNASAPVRYGAYGDGAKPILQGSVARDQSEEWSEVRPGLWATRKLEPRLIGQPADLRGAEWHRHHEGGAAVRLERMQEEGSAFTRVTCETPGKAPHHIQLWGPAVALVKPCMVLRLRARSTRSFALPAVRAILNSVPYSCALAGASAQSLGAAWQTLDIVLTRQQTLGTPYLHLSLGDILPAGAVFDFEAIGLWEADIAHCEPLNLDVGIVILNHGEKWGVKKWTLDDVKTPLDYWYDPDNKRIFLAWPANPADAFTSVELALTRHIIEQGGRHDILYDGLAVRYGAAHGFGGGTTRRITIRNCDICWIGGGLQYWKTRENGSRYPVRFGNGIEFWGHAHDHVVEYNRLWQIYDAALTHQGVDDNETGIVYRHNIIWQAEYSFEFWNRGRTENILFEHNTCVDAGDCWSHNQRPDPNGAHLMFYNNRSATTNFVIRNNIFCRSSDRCTRMFNDWRAGLTLNNNLYWSPDKPILRWLEKTNYEQADFARYQSELGLDHNSLVAEPQFANPAARDYRLNPGSPGCALATDGGPVGARWPAPQ